MWTDDAMDALLEFEPFLVVQLKPGWHHDPESGTFRHRGQSGDADEIFDPGPDLPAETRIVLMLPDLAGKSAESLSEFELSLALYLHLFPGPEADLHELLKVITAWSCVESAHRPPRISLP